MKTHIYRNLVMWIWISSVCSAPVALGALIEMDPDNSESFTPNGVFDGHGVTIRSWSQNPPNPLSIWNQPPQKLYVRSPDVGGVPYLGLEPSTGNYVLGAYGQVNLHVTTLLGDSGYYHFLFDNPTDFVGIDLLWPDSTWTEGVVMHAWAKDASGVEQVIFGKVYDERPAGSYTRVGLFYPGITRMRLYAHDKTGFQGRNFGLDNLNFVNTDSASALTLEEGETIVAPQGLTLGVGDSLSGEGTIDGSLSILGGTVSPGASPGTISVTGDYAQDGMSKLLMDLTADQQDHLLVGGSAMLAGTLELNLPPEFHPLPGQTFTLLTYSDREGMFNDIRGLEFPGGKFQPTYGPTSFFLTAVPEPATHLLVLAGIIVAGIHLRQSHRLKSIC